MSATQPLCYLAGINPKKLSKEENLLLEAELFARICEELKELFREHYKDYFRLMKFTTEMENTMLESNFVRFIIKDILMTEEYTLEGIAQYVNTPDDVIQEVVAGLNVSPSVTFVRKVIELHREVKRDLYQAVIKKITLEYLAVA